MYISCEWNYFVVLALKRVRLPLLLCRVVVVLPRCSVAESNQIVDKQTPFLSQWCQIIMTDRSAVCVAMQLVFVVCHLVRRLGAVYANTQFLLSSNVRYWLWRYCGVHVQINPQTILQFATSRAVITQIAHLFPMTDNDCSSSFTVAISCIRLICVDDSDVHRRGLKNNLFSE